jgi:phytoene desaturase
LRERIVCEQVWTRERFRRSTARGGQSLRRIVERMASAFLRPPNRSKTVKGLYFVGEGTHPGGGLPLVTLSGKIVAEAVLSDFSLTPRPPLSSNERGGELGRKATLFPVERSA